MKMNKQEISIQLKNLWDTVKFSLFAIIIGLTVGAIVIQFSGNNGIAGIIGLIRGGYGNRNALTTTLNRATPIIFAGLSASLAWGSGYSSMGASGQMILGAFASAVIAIHCPGPAWFVVIISILAAAATGMLFSLLSAYISETFDAYLLIVTLMLNYVAENIASYLTTYTFRDPLATDRLAVQTQAITNALLPRIFPKYTVHYGFILAIVFVILSLFILKRTSFGYKAKMGGLNPRFVEYGGVHRLKTMYTTLALSGALAGIGGVVEVLGTRYRYIDNMITSPGYAWSGITASLMSANHPIGVLFSSIFLAGLTTGGSSIELRMGIPSEITSIIQGVITMFVTVKIVFYFKKKNKIQVKRRITK